jgi:L-asparaginase
MQISLIQTGGTIDKDYPKSIHGWAFEISEPAYLRIIEKLPKNIEWESIPLLKKDSTQINEADRKKILKTCIATESKRIIITHGTDTLLETAAFLSSIKNKTIVLTGSMRPERFSNSDADINLGMALAAVQTLESGVYIAIQGLIAPYDKMKRNLETGNYFIESES